MIATNKESASESGEGRLVEHLSERVRAGLSGRDGADLVDQVPFRTIFAGVLQAPRRRDEEAAEKGSSAGDAPVGTALGLDFRVRPRTDSTSVTLRVIARWAHYYPVFPTWHQAVGANSGDPEPDHDPGEVETDANPTDTADPPEASTKDEEDAPSAEPSGRIVLQRVWRRLPVVVEPVTIGVPATTQRGVIIGSPEVETALAEAQARIAADKRAWHHLGEISANERILGDRSTLENEDAFEAALSGRRGRPASPPAWSARLQVDSEPDPVTAGAYRVRVLLANVTPERPREGVDAGLEERSLFDAEIEIAVDGAVLPFDFLLAPKDYRVNREMPAKGINCSARWDPGERETLRTETLPVFAQPLYRTRDSLQVPFESLTSDKPQNELLRVASEMDQYLTEWADYLRSAGSQHLTPAERTACESDRDAFGIEAHDFRLGVECLARDAVLCRAFSLMNRTFAAIGAKSAGRLKAWRLFQIGFICSQLPSLAVRELNPASADDFAVRVRERFGQVGVLWFPTGGGKTEAYLGLIAVSLLYDRLRGKSRGMSAWMRFPLRMLSLQQLDRLAKVIAALNELRATESTLANGDPFAIGYYVGDNNTPNAISDDDMRQYESNKALRDEVKLVRDCPHCGSSVKVTADRGAWRLSHVCEDPGCFSNVAASLGSRRGSLPIFVVDNEIYRYLPSVLVGTVDKIAIVGRSRYFAHLTRGVTQECPEHGYTSYDECIEHWNGCKRKRSQLSPLPSIRDAGPSLLIQDELHLLRDELGVFNGHYEGLLRYLCSRTTLPPKVLCATATIEAYDVQAFHIYLSRAKRFPQPGWLAGESFYATSSPPEQRRFYLGLMCHTRAIEDAALRVVALYQREVRRLQAAPADALAIVGEAISSSAIERLLRFHDLSVCYVNRKATGGSIIEKMPRADQILKAENLGELNPFLLTGDQTIDEVGSTLERIEREADLAEGPRLDVLAATNLISHGVDLERINMMAICGMPSHYAEYVQATSRSSRSHPGLVFGCFNSRDPRERSQFEFFYPMHQHMERLIEAVAVNRFASYAPIKTVPGLLVGLLLSLYTPELFGRLITKPLDQIPTLQAALGLRASGGGSSIDQADLCSAIEKIIGVDSVHPPSSQAQVDNAQRQVRLTFEDLMGAIGRTLETKLQEVVHPITSFRDVDEGIEFGSIDSASLITRMRSR